MGQCFSTSAALRQSDFNSQNPPSQHEAHSSLKAAEAEEQHRGRRYTKSALIPLPCVEGRLFSLLHAWLITLTGTGSVIVISLNASPSVTGKRRCYLFISRVPLPDLSLIGQFFRDEITPLGQWSKTTAVRSFCCFGGPFGIGSCFQVGPFYGSDSGWGKDWPMSWKSVEAKEVLWQGRTEPP